MLLASDYDKSKYLKATDLDRERKFRIKSVTADELGVGKDKETKLVVWFTNDERGLVLNKTNNRALRGAFGDNTADWATELSRCFRRRWTFAARWAPHCGCAFCRRSRLQRRLRQRSRRRRPEMGLRQHHRRRHRLLLIRSSSRIRNSR